MDIDICIYWLKGNRNIASKIEAVGIEKIGVIIITACELYFGAYNSQKKAANIATLDELFTQLRVIQTSFETARIFADRKMHLRKEGIIINDADMLIASVV